MRQSTPLPRIVVAPKEDGFHRFAAVVPSETREHLPTLRILFEDQTIATYRLVADGESFFSDSAPIRAAYRDDISGLTFDIPVDYPRGV